MQQYGIGQPVRRTEDPRLLRGRGRFTDDISLPRQAYAWVLRSPHAHAVVRTIDAAPARDAPGVLAVLTSADAEIAALGPFVAKDGLVNRDGSTPPAPPHPMLARDRVRYVGQPVALVVAETAAQAEDAGTLIAVAYEPLPAVTDAVAALAPGAVQLWEEAPGNLAIDWAVGERAATEAAFAAARHTARIEVVDNRVLGAPIEPLAAVGEYDPARGRYTLYAPSQGVHGFRRIIAREVLGVPEAALRFVTPDTGGGFGVREAPKLEFALVLVAARRLGRPVKWSGSRADTMVADHHGRDQRAHAALALDARGRFLAVKVEVTANIGSFAARGGRNVPTVGYAAAITGVYDIPAYYVGVRGAFTNTVHTDSYRGAGRPESIYVLERLIDRAAADLGLAPAELRRRNLVPAAAMPYTTATGERYDSGDFGRILARGLAAADLDGLAARRADAEARGRRRGLGVALYLKINGGVPDEMAEIRFEVGGEVAVVIGTQSNGQGHETTFAQIVADRLGVAFERIRVVQGDTDLVPYGQGTGGSSGMAVGGSAVVEAAAKIVETGTRFASHLMEAAEADISFADGRFTVSGTDRSVTIAEVAEAAYTPGAITAALGFGLAERALYLARARTYPNGCHVCEVEVDTETGRVALARYLVIDDLGVVLNPLLAEAQIHGGVVQGIGQALWEDCAYDPDSGQLLAGSFMDYAMPRAADLPFLEIAFEEGAPCATNPLGVKGAGEAGTTGARPAVVSAVVDALGPLGVRHLDMPLTAERVWRAMRAARA